MMPTTEHVLRLERTFSASRERVFAAWTDPELMRIWSAPAELRIGEADTDLRVGGRFHAEMIHQESGERHVVVGRYLEIDRPSRLRFTHGWLHEGEEPEDVDPRATIVTVELLEKEGGTRMILTQRGFPSQASRDGHGEGWESAFDKLADLLSSQEAV